MSNINKHSERFTNAVTKLYNAFHKRELNANDPCACAVGNICDNTSQWSTGNNYFYPKSGYSPKELFNIEDIFMFGSVEASKTKWLSSQVISSRQDNKVFEALCAVVDYKDENFDKPLNEVLWK